MKVSRTLSMMFPGSQKVFFSFFLTDDAESIKSIFESSSDELIFAPVKEHRLVTVLKIFFF